jgi:hypothetical protein
MARTRDHRKHLATAAEDLVRALSRFVDLAGDAMKSGGGAGAGRSASSGANGVASTGKRRGPGKGNPALKRKLKAYWANLSAADRKARIAKMHAWRKK